MLSGVMLCPGGPPAKHTFPEAHHPGPAPCHPPPRPSSLPPTAQAQLSAAHCPGTAPCPRQPGSSSLGSKEWGRGCCKAISPLTPFTAEHLLGFQVSCPHPHPSPEVGRGTPLATGCSRRQCPEARTHVLQGSGSHSKRGERLPVGLALQPRLGHLSPWQPAPAIPSLLGGHREALSQGPQDRTGDSWAGAGLINSFRSVMLPSPCSRG